jgi:hypothetical protein
LVTSPVWLMMALAAMSPLGILVAGAATTLLVRNLLQNLRAIRADAFLKAVAQLPRPLVALMDGRELQIRSASAPGPTSELHISAREERQLRQLALPVARARLGPERD